MGINLGAFFGPLLCGFLGEGYNWHLGFSLAGVGMVAGLVQYRLTGHHLGSAGVFEADAAPEVMDRRASRFYAVVGSVAALVVVVVALARSGQLRIDFAAMAQSLGVVIVGIAVLYFAYVILFGGHTAEENRRLGVIFWLFLLAALFWSGFEQAGSSMTLFAERLTDRVLLGWEVPASWLQSVNPVFIILLAPVFGSLWTWLANRNRNPSIPMKFALGLLALAGGFFVVAWGAANASEGNPAAPVWLIVTYFLHTVGELALSPVGLSSMTKLAPKGRVGQMMGVWFIAAALGNLVAGLVAGSLETLPPAQLFRTVAMITGGVGLVAVLASPGVKKLMGRVE
jgi:POT family proton-dependent oligopeptide transporter